MQSQFAPHGLHIARSQLALEIVEKLQSDSHAAFLVGGCVRDRLLGIQPKDYDVGTSAPPESLQRLFPDSQLVGAHFGVVLVRKSPGVHVEVSTFRCEGEYTDGRRPGRVSFVSDPKLDARRRDFTINGLFENAVTRDIYDYVGGQSDLQAKTIRAIGDPFLRFREDHLRMLRAVRFASRLGFAIEPATMQAIQELAPNINRISAERIRDELTRILTEGGARLGFELLDETGLLPILLPEIKAFQGVQQPPQFHPEGDVWEHVLLMLERLENPSAALAWGVLLHDVGKPPTYRVADRIRFDGHAEMGAHMAQRILQRLKLPAAEVDQITSLVANHMKFKDVRQMRVSTLKRFLRLPAFEEHLALHRLDCGASNGLTGAYDFVMEQLAHLDDWQLRPPRLISGKDLIEAGYKPGPMFALALEAVESAQLESSIATPAEALQLAETFLKESSSGVSAK